MIARTFLPSPSLFLSFSLFLCIRIGGWYPRVLDKYPPKKGKIAPDPRISGYLSSFVPLHPSRPIGKHSSLLKSSRISIRDFALKRTHGPWVKRSPRLLVPFAGSMFVSSSTRPTGGKTGLIVERKHVWRVFLCSFIRAFWRMESWWLERVCQLLLGGGGSVIF